MKLNNKGLSLLEVLIVIVIIAIIIGGVTVGLSALMSKPADECANKLVSSLQSARVNTMGKQGLVLEVYEQNQCIYLRETITKGIGTAQEISELNTLIGQKGVKVEYKWNGASGYTTLGSSSIKIEFNRQTGGLKPDPTTSDYLTSFRISKGSRVLTIDIAYLTGHVTLTN